VERFMRACVFAVGIITLAQPAFARDFHKSSHHVSRHHHHHVAHARPHHRKARIVRVRGEAPIISGYSMPQSFARTDAVDSPSTQLSAPAAVPGTFAETLHTRAVRADSGRNTALDAAIARHAAANGLPAELVHRVVIRESRYNPRASNRGALGLMQIKPATARGVGYTGPASGLFDAETNLTYAVRYLAGAYRAAGGNQGRAVALYASGYHGRGIAARGAPRDLLADASASSVQPTPVAMREDVALVREPRRRARR
jgi:soluble lytic murein transglycosylase-like protein